MCRGRTGASRRPGPSCPAPALGYRGRPPRRSYRRYCQSRTTLSRLAYSYLLHLTCAIICSDSLGDRADARIRSKHVIADDTSSLVSAILPEYQPSVYQMGGESKNSRMRSGPSTPGCSVALNGMTCMTTFVC